MKFKKILIVIVMISLISTFILGYNRIKSEKQADTMALVLSYSDLEEMAKQSENDIEFWLNKFKALGVNKVAVNEINIEYLLEKDFDIKAGLIKDLKQEYNYKSDFDEKIVNYLNSSSIDENDFYIRTYDNELYKDLIKRLKGKYDESFFKSFKSSKDEFLIVLDGEINDSYYQVGNVLINNFGKNVKREEKLVSSRLKEIGLGYDEKVINKIEEEGLTPVLRPYNYKRYSEENLNYYINYIEENNLNSEYIIFDGNSVLGYPENTDRLVEFMKDNEIKPILIESTDQLSNIEQDGLNNLVRNLDYESIRLFSIIDYIQQRYGYYNYSGSEEIENTIVRAVIERDIRLIYFRPFKYDEKKYVTNPQDYEIFFNRLQNRFKTYNIKFGSPKPIGKNIPRLYLLILSALGVLSLFILILMNNLNFNKKIVFSLFILGLISIFGVGVYSKMIFSVIMAFVTVIVFAVLSADLFIDNIFEVFNKNDDKTFVQQILSNIKLVISVLLISLIGGFYVAAFISHSEFLLEMSYFRGVKLSLLLPLIITIVIYTIKFGFKRGKNYESKENGYLNDVLDIFEETIKVKYVIVLGLIAIAGFIYIARSGNEIEIPILKYELIMRNYLENHLFARPRTKEFLIAFPSLMAAMYFAQNKIKKLIFPFLMVGSIGFTSILNTFSHSRTPIYLSFYRTITSIAFGVIVGVIGVYIFDLILRVYNRRFSHE